MTVTARKLRGDILAARPGRGLFRSFKALSSGEVPSMIIFFGKHLSP